ncbi:MAG: hypothetical protein OXF02_00460 [Simkaniaceae bacterium]|nr:hypothetical protein [Simkaniaceae bacterium]
MFNKGDTHTADPLPPPHANYAWALCQAVIDAQNATGYVLSQDGSLANTLGSVMHTLNEKFLGSPEDAFKSEPIPKDGWPPGTKTLNWLAREMANIAAGSESKDKQSQDINILQSIYSATNAAMQQQTNTLNGSAQAQTQQTQEDQSFLQAMTTTATVGSASMSYLATLLQSVM